MPSASSNVKVEKQQPSNATNAAEIVDNNKVGLDGNSAINQVNSSIAHKIRNLEKRKGKLESYRDTEKSGKELSNDQKVAVSKYNEVTQTLEFAREFQKQILQIASVTEKELKKKQKLDEATKRRNEANKIREVLIIQDILNLLTDNEIRQDFLNGSNGACRLEKNELDILDKFQSEVIPKHPNGPDEVPFRTAVQKAVDHFLMTIDGKPKDFGETKYTDIKNIFKNIQKCGYFDKAAQPPVTETNCAEPTVNPINDVEVHPLEQDTATETEIVPQERKDFLEAPAAANLPVPTFPPQPHLIPAQTPQIVQQVSLVQSIGPLVGMAPPIPTTGQIHQHLVDVQAVEQGYFKSQYIRPIADVIGQGQGNFFFLQDSELDSPDVIPGNYQQHQPPNSQISPNQPVNHQIPTQQPGVVQPSQQQQQILPATQLSTQTFNNQSFQNIVPPQMYTKPIDHIGQYVPPPVAVPLVVPNHQQKEQSSQINNQSQILANNSAPISFQPTNQQNMPKAQRHRPKDTKQMKNDQRVPEITEWKPEDAAKPPEEITEWRDQYANTAVTDWNEETNEDSSWSNNRGYQYRNNGGGGGGGSGSRDRNNRGGPRGPGNAPNGYRQNRQSNSYQSNGRQSGSGGGERGGNGGSFYRNESFYPNGNYKDKQDGGYRGDNKQDGGFKGGNFRSRDSREQVNGSMRTGGPRNVRNGDSAERDRGSNRNTAQNPRPTNKGGNSYGSAATRTAPTGNSTRPQSAVNA